MNKSAAVMEAMVNKAFRKKGWNKFTCFYYHGGKFYIGRYDVKTGRLKSYGIGREHLPQGEYEYVNFDSWRKCHLEYLQEEEYAEYLAKKQVEDKELIRRIASFPKEVQKELDLRTDCQSETELELKNQVEELRAELQVLRKHMYTHENVSLKQHDTEYGMLDVMAKLEQKLQAFEDKLTSMEGSIRKLSNQQLRFVDTMKKDNLNLYSALQNTELELISIMEKTSRRGKKVRELHENLRKARNSVGEL